MCPGSGHDPQNPETDGMSLIPPAISPEVLGCCRSSNFFFRLDLERFRKRDGRLLAAGEHYLAKHFRQALWPGTVAKHFSQAL